MKAGWATLRNFDGRRRQAKPTFLLADLPDCQHAPRNPTDDHHARSDSRTGLVVRSGAAVGVLVVLGDRHNPLQDTTPKGQNDLFIWEIVPTPFVLLCTQVQSAEASDAQGVPQK